MTTSSVPTDYLTTSSDVISIGTSTISNITVSGTGSSYYYVPTSAGTITLNGSSGYTLGSGATISTISPLTIDQVNSWSAFNVPKEFVDCFPAWSRIEEMCKQYPGLQIAFEKFKRTYYLVKDDYDTPEDQRPLP